MSETLEAPGFVPADRVRRIRVSPASIAAWAAARTGSGVSKSGSPAVMSTMSRPAAFSSRARAAAATVGETRMRPTRSAGTKAGASRVSLIG